MSPIGAIVAVANLAGLAGAAPVTPLERFVSFKDPYSCTPTDDFGALVLDAQRWPASRAGAKPVIPPVVAQQIGKPEVSVEDGVYHLIFPVKGRWFRLTMTSIIVVQRPESEGGFRLVFAATPNQVRQTANRLGFRIPAGREEYRDSEIMGVTVGVEPYMGNGSLYCFDG